MSTTNNSITRKRRKFSHHEDGEHEEAAAVANNNRRNKIIDEINKLGNVSDELRDTLVKAVLNDPTVEELKFSSTNVIGGGSHDDVAIIIGRILPLNNVVTSLLILLDIGISGIEKISEGLQYNSTINKFTFCSKRRYDVELGGAIKNLLQSRHSIRTLFLPLGAFNMSCFKLILEGLKHTDTVESLHLMMTQPNDECCNALTEMLEVNRSIKIFNLIAAFFNVSSMKILCKALEQNNVIEEVGIGSKGRYNAVLNDQHLQCWQNVLKSNNRIKKIIMHNCSGGGDKGIVSFFEGIEHGNNTIETIHLYGSTLGIDGVESIEKTLRNTQSKLKSFYFGRLDTSSSCTSQNLITDIVKHNFNIEQFHFEDKRLLITTELKKTEFYTRLNKVVKRRVLHNFTNNYNCWPYILAKVGMVDYYSDYMKVLRSVEEPDQQKISKLKVINKRQQLSALLYVIQSKPDLFKNSGFVTTATRLDLKAEAKQEIS